MIDVVTLTTSAVVSLCIAWAVAWATAKRTIQAHNAHDADETKSSPRVLCTACGLTYQTRADAREHARDAHGAPGDAAAVDEVLAVVEDG